MSNTAAWILRVNDTICVSVAQADLVHVLMVPEMIPVPKAPTYCRHTVVWNSHILPVLDLGSLLNDNGAPCISHVTGVFMYSDSISMPQYGAMMLQDPPVLEQVANSQICELPDDLRKLETISLSCFTSESGHSVPILDVSKMFSRHLSGQAPVS